MLNHAPQLTTADAERLAAEQFGRPGRARELPSERDQNFEIAEADGARFVLKIANALETSEMLEAQQSAIAHLAGRDAPTPRLIAARDGALLVSAGGGHLAWAVTYLPGIPLARATHRPAELLQQLGAVVADVANAFCDFDRAALHRDFHWDLASGHGRVDAPFADRVSPLLPSLRRGLVHGDLNDHNVLVDGERVSGVVDFGDMVYSWIVSDLAIAAAYAMLDARDPLAVLGHLVRGYHARRPLTEPELEALFGLVCLRLSMSTSIAAEQQRVRPKNVYLAVSQEPIRRTLPRLAATPYDLAAAVVREAAALEPVPSSAHVRKWLAASRTRFAPVLDVDVRTERCVVLDLSVASPLIAGDLRENEEPKITPRIFGAIADAAARVGIGRYDEPRLLYTAPFFETEAGERRTIHIGLDLFAPPGTPVHAPLDGVVHAFAENAVPQDYGPVIILRHETGDGIEFFTLYGHLSRESLAALHVGQRISRGARFASLGTPDENVGWTPHLHLQIITNLLGFGCDFPGVAPASERGVWRSLSPDPNIIVGVPDERFLPGTPAISHTIAARRRLTSASLGVAYREPVKVMRGWMQYLYDGEGRRYLDAYNNVPHVGHAHPAVVDAGQRQMAVLNTNTRYPSDLLNAYATRLLATFPEPLRRGVAFFVNSASEANELAVRLARAHTRAKDMIVLEAAYHGNTTTLIDLSPYKHAGPGGTGKPDWVHVAPLPDDYRGPYKRGDPSAGARYAASVGTLVEALRTRERHLCGFIAESCPSVGGQIVFPHGYLAGVYEQVRAAGGVCIADEVQTGLGRMGTHFWAFEMQGVVPDIVVMGKPLGNGHPIGAVVVRREIATSFENGMEFFSTFGGNSVSCAIGLAVLDVVHDEQLQAHARCVGDRMLSALAPMVDRRPLVGDVRGSGLFLGVELVRDRETLEPAPEEASDVVNRLREEGILLGTDGPYHNVLKIRPPMPFSDADADRLVGTLESVLASSRASGPPSSRRT